MAIRQKDTTKTINGLSEYIEAYVCGLVCNIFYAYYMQMLIKQIKLLVFLILGPFLMFLRASEWLKCLKYSARMLSFLSNMKHAHMF